MADADSLVLFIDNTEPLYRQKRAIQKNMALKKARGVYDEKKAPQAFMWVVERGAKEFVKEEHDTRPWHVVFSKEERQKAAREFAAEFEGMWKIPEEQEHWRKQLPKKYQSGAVAAPLGAADLRARRRGAYSLADLRRLPVVSEGHSGNLLVDTGKTRLWLSRLTKEDGAKFDHEVSVETLGPKGWRTTLTYGAKADRGGKKVALAALVAAERAWAANKGSTAAVADTVKAAWAAGASHTETDRAKQRGLQIELGTPRASRHERGGNPRISGRGGKPPTGRARMLGRRYNAVAWSQWNPGTPEPWNYPQSGDFESAESDLRLVAGSLSSPQTPFDHKTSQAFKEGFKEANDQARKKEGARTSRHERGENPRLRGGKTTDIVFHKDGTATAWNVYSQTRTRLRRGKVSDELFASLSTEERDRVTRHLYADSRKALLVDLARTKNLANPVERESKASQIAGALRDIGATEGEIRKALPRESGASRHERGKNPRVASKKATLAALVRAVGAQRAEIGRVKTVAALTRAVGAQRAEIRRRKTKKSTKTRRPVARGASVAEARLKARLARAIGRRS